MYGVDSAAPSISESGRARGTHVPSREKFSNKSRCRSEGQKAEGRSEKGGTGGVLAGIYPLPQGTLPCSNGGAICGFSQQRSRKTSRAVV